MDEIRRGLEDEARRVHPDPGALEVVRRRARRRTLRRRAVTTVLVVGVTGATFALAYGAFRPGNDLIPAAGPTPTVGATTGAPGPRYTRSLIEVFDAAPDIPSEELDHYLDVLFNSGEFPYVVVGVEETEGSEVTVVSFHPVFKDRARYLIEQWLPYAQERVDRDPPLIRIVVGEDFEAREALHVRNVATAMDFMQGRIDSDERARAHLTPGSADQFERSENGLDLYGYAAGGEFEILLIDRRQDDRTLVHLRIRKPMKIGHLETLETLVVGDEDGDGRPEILSAERNR